MRIGYLGPEGTFSQQAALEYSKGSGCKFISYESIPEMLLAVNNRELDEAIAPIENSIEGAVNATLDILSDDVELKIKYEFVLMIRQNLMAAKGAKLEGIKTVISHPQPLGQCKRFLRQKLPGVECRYSFSTAKAAEAVAAGNGGMASIGSRIAAEIYGLEILAEDIQDESNNFTRFVAISGHDSQRTGNDKTSIVFSAEDKPGSLYRILDIFNLWDINMTRIESRPARNRLGRYIFFVDFSGHRDDTDIKDALTMIRRKTSFFKFLGSYPAWTEQTGN